MHYIAKIDDDEKYYNNIYIYIYIRKLYIIKETKDNIDINSKTTKLTLI